MRRWSKSEDDYIREFSGNLTHKKIAENLHRTVNAVRHRSNSLLDNSGKFFSDAEDDMIKRYYLKHAGRDIDLGIISRLIGRSRQSISRRAALIGAETNSSRPLSGSRKAELSRDLKNWHSNNEHPRGFSGHNHTDKAKSIISQKSKSSWAGFSHEKRSEITEKSMKTAIRNGTNGPPKNGRGSWKSGWREIGGVRKYYRSRWEANYAYYLEWLRCRGEIKSWEHEPETFWFEKIKRGVRSYKPDFKVVGNDGSIVWHEVKGWMDSRSKTTIRRFGKYYPDETLLVIDAPKYNAIAKTMSILIPEWER